MKKIAFFSIMVFALFALSDTLIAKTDTEYETALQYYNSGKFKEAIRLLKVYVEKRPEPSAYYRIGYALYKLKQFKEANKYFDMTYLIDPMFSPIQYGLPELPEDIKKAVKPPKEAPSKKTPQAAVTEEKQPAKKEPTPLTQPLKPVQPPKETMPLPAPQQVKPPQAVKPEDIQPPKAAQPPTVVPTFPEPRKEIPLPPPRVKPGVIAGFGVFSLILSIALYIYFSLCMYLIAKKLNVSAPWIAFIPIIQIWIIVASAGKPWWWILLLLIPIVNIFISIYIWLCITENLGRNKWLGLLMLVPIVNLVFLGMLAFSKTEELRYTEATTT